MNLYYLVPMAAISYFLFYFQVLFGVVCPAAFVAGGAAVTALSNGTAAAAGATAMSAGTQACSVANKELCKRSVRDVSKYFSKINHS